MKGPCFLWKKAGWCHIQQPRWHYRFFVSPCLTWGSLSPVWLGTALIRRVQRVFFFGSLPFHENHGVSGCETWNEAEKLGTKRKSIVSQPAHGFRQALESCCCSEFFAFGNFMCCFTSEIWNSERNLSISHITSPSCCTVHVYSSLLRGVERSTWQHRNSQANTARWFNRIDMANLNSFNIYHEGPMGLVYLLVFLHTSKYPLKTLKTL